MKNRKKLIVVKMGSGLLARSQGAGIDTDFVLNIAGQIAALRKKGYQTIIVSSGAVSSGMMVLKISQRPRELATQQMCAMIGQPLLMQAYNEAFKKFHMCTGQILLTSWDLDSQKMYRNAQITLDKLLGLKNCVPIFNENDAISFEELAFGDNDTLSGHITLLSKASQLIILSTIEGLKTKQDGTGDLIKRVKAVDKKIESYAGKTNSERSLGGMISKVRTAKWMMENKIPVVIANGRVPHVLVKLIEGKSVGTLFKA